MSFLYFILFIKSFFLFSCKGILNHIYKFLICIYCSIFNFIYFFYVICHVICIFLYYCIIFIFYTIFYIFLKFLTYLIIFIICSFLHLIYNFLTYGTILIMLFNLSNNLHVSNSIIYSDEFFISPTDINNESNYTFIYIIFNLFDNMYYLLIYCSN